jgi:hypothetical protein
VAFLIRRFQPHTLRRGIDWAGPPRRARGVYLTDGTTRARRGEGPVPEHSGERGERPELHPHLADGGTVAPARTIPGQDACCTLFSSSPYHYIRSEAGVLTTMTR